MDEPQPTSEPSLELTPAPPALSPFASTPPLAVLPPSAPTAGSSPSSPDPTPPTSEPESEISSSPQPGSGLVAGTGTELEPGTGGLGDHPAPAAMIGPDGALHVAGEPPAGNIAGSSSPVGDTSDLASGDLSPEAKAARDAAPSEHQQVETNRPDIGTPE